MAAGVVLLAVFAFVMRKRSRPPWRQHTRRWHPAVRPGNPAQKHAYNHECRHNRLIGHAQRLLAFSGAAAAQADSLQPALPTLRTVRRLAIENPQIHGGHCTRNQRALLRLQTTGGLCCFPVNALTATYDLAWLCAPADAIKLICIHILDTHGVGKVHSKQAWSSCLECASSLIARGSSQLRVSQCTSPAGTG